MARKGTTARLSAAAAATGAVLALTGVGWSTQAAPLPPPGKSCGVDKVVTTVKTCATINSSCTGYDMMIIGRVDHTGHCVIPGMNGTTW
ncbi:hypothetical protein P0W64_03950 [Tsukamurella sp. 8F]|uniref:hypothetical protein n=1 Tax=unclassified Tsukamurella TaxID=2633480 RepID=UPI0023B88ADB|nr:MULTISPECIES: hypothetical protein [unclassified Tsukamurella]MDF0529640.1 hypothetical protein [Tsukamurella sp. 8J]MDF0585925.1 hypothetical protein [Tsukamurella sp. 8F]